MLRSSSFLLVILLAFASSCGFGYDCDCDPVPEVPSGTFSRTTEEKEGGIFPHAATATSNAQMVIDRKTGTVTISYLSGTTSVTEKWRIEL